MKLSINISFNEKKGDKPVTKNATKFTAVPYTDSWKYKPRRRLGF